MTVVPINPAVYADGVKDQCRAHVVQQIMSTTNKSLASNLDSIRKRVNTELLIKHEKIGHGAFSSHVYTENECKIFEAVLMDYALGRMTAKQVVTSYTMLGIPHLLIVEAIEEGNKTKDDLNA